MLPRAPSWQSRGELRLVGGSRTTRRVVAFVRCSAGGRSMPPLITVLLLASLAGCGRVGTDEDGAGPGLDGAPEGGGSAGVDSAGVDAFRTDARADGCPVTPAGLVRPCALGNECRYEDKCFRPLTTPSRSIELYVCMKTSETTRDWVKHVINCDTLTGADGCPLDVPVTKPSCDSVGKVCVYPFCFTATEGSVTTSTCTAVDGGSAVWRGVKSSCAGG